MEKKLFVRTGGRGGGHKNKTKEIVVWPLILSYFRVHFQKFDCGNFFSSLSVPYVNKVSNVFMNPFQNTGQFNES